MLHDNLWSSITFFFPYYLTYLTTTATGIQYLYTVYTCKTIQPAYVLEPCHKRRGLSLSPPLPHTLFVSLSVGKRSPQGCESVIQRFSLSQYLLYLSLNVSQPQQWFGERRSSSPPPPPPKGSAFKTPLKREASPNKAMDSQLLNTRMSVQNRIE